MWLRELKRSLVIAGTLALGIGACAGESDPTVSDARVFVEAAEARLLDLWRTAGRASWVQSNFITEDTNGMAAAANADVMAATTELASAAARLNELVLPEDLDRKLLRLKTSLSAVAPSDPALQQELAEIMTEMESIYGQGEFCPDGEDGCLDLPTMERMFAEVRETDELLAIWKGWREVSPQIQPLYERFVELSNAGAQELGFADLGEMWRSGYDMSPAAFTTELERLWEQVRPLYESLHCHVRAELGDQYGTAVVPPDEPIPAHLLGNMWSQSWVNISDAVGPSNSDPGYDLTQLLERRGVDEIEMVRYGERFFSSLGFGRCRRRSGIGRSSPSPADREVVCHASAWNLDYESDIRIKMCIGVNDEDFVTIHHELGHNYYQRAYSHQDLLYRDSANDGFHEGIGDTIALSITPEYLVKVGLLNRAPAASSDIGLLLRQALDKVAFLPFGLLVDQWRWKVFAGEIVRVSTTMPGGNSARSTRGSVRRCPVTTTRSTREPSITCPPTRRTPGISWHAFFQFQFHRALCEAAGVEGPLHRCSIFESAAAGQRLRTMLEMGASRPWPEALKVIAGTREMDATAILDYFAPLAAWLDKENQERTCGW